MSRFARALPLIAIAVALGSVFLWLDSDREFRRSAYEPGSLNHYGERGTSIAFRYLKERRKSGGKSVGELNRLVDQAELESDAVILRLDPQHIPGVHEEPPSMAPTKKSTTAPTKPPKPVIKKEPPLLTAGEEQFVRGGGRIVLALRTDYQTVSVGVARVSTIADKVFPLWPGFETLRAGKFQALSGSGLNSAVPLFSSNGHLLAARLTMGQGDVLVFGGADIFENDSIAEGEHAALLEALAPPNRAVYFDEFVHGLKDPVGIVELLNRWGLGLSLLLISGAGILAWWRAAVPVGPPVDDHRERRTQAVDFVGSVAPLYDHALTSRAALSMYYNQFVRAVVLRTGLRGEMLTERVRALLNGASESEFLNPEKLSPHELAGALQRLNEAFGRLERAHRR